MLLHRRREPGKMRGGDPSRKAWNYIGISGVSSAASKLVRGSSIPSLAIPNPRPRTLNLEPCIHALLGMPSTSCRWEDPESKRSLGSINRLKTTICAAETHEPAGHAAAIHGSPGPVMVRKRARTRSPSLLGLTRKRPRKGASCSMGTRMMFFGLHSSALCPY